MADARTIQQTGVVSPGHAVSWVAPGIVKDAGSSVSGQVNSFGMYGDGGLPFVITNSPTPGPFSGVYAQLGAGISQAEAYLNVNTFGTTALPLSFQINGTTIFSVSDAGPSFALPLPVASGGTGLGTTPADGELLIGNGTDYTLTTLTAGLNVGIANTPGGITISSSLGPTGVLPTANGGTGLSAVGATGTFLTSDGTVASWGALPASVTSFNTTLSGLTPTVASTGSIVLAGTLGANSGGTGTGTAFTAGSVVFAGGSGIYAQDNSHFFWDDTNNRLGVGLAAPSYTFHAQGASGNTQVAAQTTGTTGGDAATFAAISPNGTVSMQSVGSSGNTFLTSSGASLTIGTTSAANVPVLSSNVERMRVTADGHILVNTTSVLVSQAIFNVSGSIAALGLESRSGLTGSFTTYRYNIDWTGSAANLWIGSTNVGTFTLTSDYRVKQNVTSQPNGALARIAALRPVAYEYADYLDVMKADGVAREGFIAHEVAAVIPSAVNGEKDAEGQIQSLRLDALLSVTVKALQELKAEFDAYKAAHP